MGDPFVVAGLLYKKHYSTFSSARTGRSHMMCRYELWPVCHMAVSHGPFMGSDGMLWCSSHHNLVIILGHQSNSLTLAQCKTSLAATSEESYQEASY